MEIKEYGLGPIRFRFAMKSLKLIGVVCQLARRLLMNVTWI